MARDESTPPGPVLRLTAAQQDRLAQILGDLELILSGEVPPRWQQEMRTWTNCTEPVDKIAGEALDLLLEIAGTGATGHVPRPDRRCRHSR